MIKLVNLSSQILRRSSSTRQPIRVSIRFRIFFESIPSSSRVGLARLHPYTEPKKYNPTILHIYIFCDVWVYIYMWWLWIFVLFMFWPIWCLRIGFTNWELFGFLRLLKIWHGMVFFLVSTLFLNPPKTL